MGASPDCLKCGGPTCYRAFDWKYHCSNCGFSFTWEEWAESEGIVKILGGEESVEDTSTNSVT